MRQEFRLAGRRLGHRKESCIGQRRPPHAIVDGRVRRPTGVAAGAVAIAGPRHHGR